MPAPFHPYADLASLAKGLAGRQFSEVELAQAYLSRIASDATNAVLAADPEVSLTQARAAQALVPDAARPGVRAADTSRPTGRCAAKVTVRRARAARIRHSPYSRSC